MRSKTTYNKVMWCATSPGDCKVTLTLNIFNILSGVFDIFVMTM